MSTYSGSSITYPRIFEPVSDCCSKTVRRQNASM